MVETRRRSCSGIAVAAVALVLAAVRGFGQQPPRPNQQTPTGLPPGTPTQQSPSGLLIPVQPPPAPPSTLLQSYKPVTAERLKHPEDSDWLMVRRTYDGWGYSPLDQITPANVGRLQPVWLMSTGMNNGHQAPPFVNNGVMFVATSYNQLIAINARSGEELWRYRSPSPQDARVPKPVNRGVALYGEKVFFALGEAILVAIDAKTGKEIWRTAVEDNKKGYYMTAAPLVADGKVVVGISGGDGPTRGFVAAYDPETGKEAWRCFTIPAPGEPGSETWPPGDQWKTGGGATWVTGNYDPEFGRLCAAVLVHGRRQTVHRRGLGLGPGCAVDGVAHQRRLARPLPGRAGRRRHLGIRDQVAQPFRAARWPLAGLKACATTGRR